MNYQNPSQSLTGEAPSWAELLRAATGRPGRLLAAYQAFHEYSLGNQLAAYAQCVERDVPVGPLGTYRQWQDRGRQVRAGEKALWLCVPRTVKRSRAPPCDEEPAEPSATTGEEATVTIFFWQRRWFTLGQTDGSDFAPAPLPSWERDAALAALGVELTPFTHLNGNVQGYASGSSVAINPLAALPNKTLFHELGHVLLHQTNPPVQDCETTPRALREVEAEAVALLLCETLDLPGAEYARGYIQHWLGSGEEIPERSAQRILSAADKILRAGRPEVAAH